jgi:hypothetical protein
MPVLSPGPTNSGSQPKYRCPTSVSDDHPVDLAGIEPRMLEQVQDQHAQLVPRALAPRGHAPDRPGALALEQPQDRVRVARIDG